MVEVLGLVRRSVIGAAALASLGLGWILLWHVTPPGVASKLQTGVLATVVSLQVLPVLAWFAWRADRALAAEERERAAARPAARDPERAHERPLPRPAEAPVVHTGERAGEVLAVHRVVHVPRAKAPRPHPPHGGAMESRRS